MKTGKWLRVSLLLEVAWGTAGCQKVNSTDVRTSGVYAEFSVTEHSATEATVDATLQVGGELSNTYLNLTGQDRLTVYVGTNAYPMNLPTLCRDHSLSIRRHGAARGVRPRPRRCQRTRLDRSCLGALCARCASQEPVFAY